ncbi:hypothetical protein G1H11_06690 [Phytoactinopolyspora alkaliphila]|uniref:Uncharacterized protein n=1 Tax=Phytoactinopolyspora alkaliphila TaxID=1783498 RepID=A0A6N9YJ67_9ACTN|nr:hypothetical protein [Phytoactinopolyspora alkaliphila]NED94997.1 hypothetical protein [Phytoactinopolyspora alkaliphila]
MAAPHRVPEASSTVNAGVTRRRFLQQAGFLTAGGLSAGALGVSVAGPAGASQTLDLTTPAAFDAFDAAYQSGGQSPDNNNEAGALAWQQSYALRSFIMMYLAHGDTDYLDRFIGNVDIMLTHRDSERGVTDYRGLSLPAWRTMNPYTLGISELLDGNGQPTLEIRSGRNYADTAHVTVTHGAGDTFSLVVRNERFDYTDTFTGLTMDPSSPDYAVQRIYDDYPGTILCTAHDQNVGTRPAEGNYPMFAQPVILGVHTGMITYPIASFVRIVKTDPQLINDQYYQDKADEYLADVEAAVAVHDDEWRETSDGRGYYFWEKGKPFGFDGQAQPTNQSLALGRTVLELAAITGDPQHVHRATALAEMFKAELIDQVTNGVTTSIWYYFPTYSAAWEGYTKTGSAETDISMHKPEYAVNGGYKNYEDYSHAAIDVDFAALAHQHGYVFTSQDIAKIAATFTENLAATNADGRATVRYVVSGQGVLQSNPIGAARWMAISPSDPDVFEHCLDIYEDWDNQPTPTSGTRLLGVAMLNWGALQGAAKARNARRRADRRRAARWAARQESN